MNEKYRDELKQQWEENDRWAKYHIIGEQIHNKFAVTSFAKLLENFGEEFHPDKILDHDEYVKQENEWKAFIQKIDHALKKDLTMYELKKFYGMLKNINIENLYRYYEFLEKQLDNTNGLLNQRDEKIKNLDNELQRTKDILFD